MGGKTAEEPTWHTGKRCDGGQCVEIGTLGGSILIRNSDDPDGARLTLARSRWREFIAGLTDGDYDGL